MKKNLFVVLAFAVGIALFASCTSAPKAAGGETAPSQIEVDTSDDVNVDWKGRNAGVKEIPAWVALVGSGDPNGDLNRLPRLDGKKAIPSSTYGANLQMVELWLRNQAFAEITQKIRTATAVTSKNALGGELQNAEAETVADQFNTLYSQATITGLNRELDFWVKSRSKSKGTEKYTCYVIYSISKEDYQASVNETFNKIEAKTARQQEMKTKLNAQMNRLMDSINF